MAKRFIVNDEDIEVLDDDKFEITGKEVKHIQVLRYNIGDEIKINEYICLIEQMTKNSIVLQKVGNVEKQGEPNLNLNLYIALLKNEKLDYAVQKSVELGVKNIIPFISKNVIVKLDDKARKKRVQKLQTIANEACKQCGRTDTVKVCDIISFDELLKDIKDIPVNIFAYEKEKKSVKSVFSEIKAKYEKDLDTISCIVGPEGGFAEDESISLSSNENVYTISLGTRILRADTAVINIISLIMYEFEK